jgi:arabinogalactan oligomer/maltooligosaccharide transport system permease protein
MASEQRAIATPAARPAASGVSTFSSARTRQKMEVWGIRLLLIIICTASLFPTIYVVLYSLKGGGPSLYSPTFIPETLTLDNYEQLLRGTFPRWVMNSLIYGICAGVIAVTFATFAGYAFSRMRFKGRRYGILTLLVVQMLPANLALIAYLKMFQAVDLLNTRAVMILLFGFGGSALAVWLMKNFMDTVPRDLDEAASLDGASHWRAFWTIIFPLVQPMLVAQFIFGFIGVYNDYLVTTVLLSNPKLYPLGVGVRTFSTQFNTNWTQFCAAAVLGSLPILVVFFLAQRMLVEGLTKGAVKG